MRVIQLRILPQKISDSGVIGRMAGEAEKLPDLVSLIPECQAKDVLLFCFDTLKLSTEDAERVLHASCKLAQSIDWLLRGGSFDSISHEERT